MPFLRMIIISHVLGPYEFGFAAALSASYATIEMVTDTSLYRFVVASPRERYAEALATSHGISLIRGLLVAVVFWLAAYPVSCSLVSCSDWSSFAWLAPITVAKSMENLELRVYERDYRYWPQLVGSVVSHGSGLVALTVVAILWETHWAILSYLLVQAAVYTLLTHLLSVTPYRVKLGGPMVPGALRYSLPLMLNGLGNAIMAQGDRLFVGAYLGLQTLGLYAVMILTAYVPTSGLFRLMGPVQLAGLINSVDRPDVYAARLKLYGRVVPMVAAVYALGWIVLSRPLVPMIFGARFVVGEPEALLIGLIVYFRICRAEPSTSLFLQTHNTHRLAIANQLPMVGLALGACLAWFHPALVSVLIGSVCGEMLSLAVMVRGTRSLWTGRWADGVTWAVAAALLPLAAGLVFLEVLPTPALLPRLAVGLAFFAVICVITPLATHRLFGRGYRARPAPVPTDPVG